MRPLIGCLVFSVACSAQVVGETDAETAKLTAVVEVDRTISDMGDLGHGSAIARFVRASDDSALQLVSAIPDTPALGTCATNGSPSTAQHPVELVDVGNVSIESTGVRSTLVARRMPDVVDLVSGVVYTARGPEDGSFGAGHYLLRVGGNADVPSFVREADAPAVPSMALTSLVVDGATDLAWEAGSPGDIVLIEITGAPATMRCAFGDTGHSTIPAAAFGAQGVVTLHRIHREPFVSPGVDRGEIRFDFARSITYKHR